MSAFITKDADGSRGGIVTAWNPTLFALLLSSSSHYSLIGYFSCASSGTPLTITNVYAPSDHSLTDDFVMDMLDVPAIVSGAWLVVGDFNLIHHP